MDQMMVFSMGTILLVIVIINGFVIDEANAIYSMAKLNIRTTRDSQQTQHHHNSDSCPPCNTHNCPMVMPETCHGKIVKDQCECCPVCNVTDVSVISTDLHDEHDGTVDVEDNHTEDPEACKQIECPRQQICLLNIQGIPVCRCPSSLYCKERPRKDVCSVEDKTYRSLCYLKMEACVSNRKIGVKHKGPCEVDVISKEERKRVKEEKKKERLDKNRLRMEKKTNKKKNKERNNEFQNKEPRKTNRRKDKNNEELKSDGKNAARQRGKLFPDGKKVGKERKDQLRQERRRHRRRLRKIMNMEAKNLQDS